MASETPSHLRKRHHTCWRGTSGASCGVVVAGVFDALAPMMSQAGLKTRLVYEYERLKTLQTWELVKSCLNSD